MFIRGGAETEFDPLGHLRPPVHEIDQQIFEHLPIRFSDHLRNRLLMADTVRIADARQKDRDTMLADSP
jgi:hypothetical protein